MFVRSSARPWGLALATLLSASAACAANLFPGDTSFETGPGIMFSNAYRGGVVAKWNPDSGAIGRRSVTLEWNYNDSIFGPDVWLKKGPHTLSFYARSAKPVTLRPHVFRSNWSKTVSLPAIELTPEWKRYTGTVQLNGGFNFLSLGSDAGAVVDIDGVQLVAGSEAGDFETASPVNVATYIPGDTQGVFFPTEPVSLVVSAHGPVDAFAQKRAALDLTVTSLDGAVVFRKSVAAQIENPDDLAQLTATLTDLAPGYYSTEAVLTLGTKQHTHHGSFAVVAPPVPIAEGLEPFSGINTPAETPGIRRIGARWVGDPIRWANLEPSEGAYRWGSLDAYMSRKNPDERVILDITEVPRWAWDPREVAEVKQLGLAIRYGLLPAREKIPAWRAFIRALAERYGRAVHVWEIGREDDLVWQKHPYYSRQPGGCDARRSELIRIAAEEIRAVIPDARVGGVRPSGVDSIDARPKLSYTRSIYSGTNGTLNILPLDPYTSSRVFDPKRKLNVLHPEAYLTDGYNAARAFMKDLGMKPAFYNSEIGYAIEHGEPLAGESGKLYAAYLARTFLVNRTTEDFLFTRWFVAHSPIEADRYQYGIWRDIWPTPAVPAFATVAGIVENTRRHALIKISADVWATVFDKGDSATAALWHLTGHTSVRLSLPDAVRFTNMVGAPVKPPAADTRPGATTLSTDVYPLYLQRDGADSFERLKAAFDSAREVGFPVEIKVAANHASVWQIQLRNKLKESLTVSLEARQGADYLANEVTLRPNETRIVPFSVAKAAKHEGVLSVRCRAGDAFEPYARDFPFAFTPVTAAPSAPQIRMGNQENVRPLDPYVAWGGEPDLSANVTIRWDKTHLHVAATVSDDVHHNRSPENELWTGDSLQIGIDSRGEDGLRSAVTQFSPHDYEVVVALNNGKVRSFQSAGQTELLSAADAVSVVRDDAARTTRYEVKIPWENLGVTPVAGAVLGFNVAIFDNDGGRVDHWLQWSDGLTGGAKNFSLFNKVVLVGP